ncbi:SusC/RagA family TonB-linked outer membrane protein [Chitinophaga rhizosphaerae]|uniref:SusC/RagA family TonB-linked outer membrane protein n=1 Tax=Chitinophaga rhizosphaerae TaxID=1864947 RepID=UPI000F8127DE|nr:SusC/RagA family TonB-linked outer membrane protein [Chitinophaga rhizosphaerae]
MKQTVRRLRASAKHYGSLLLLWCLAIAWAASAQAQNRKAALKGVVQDNKGASIPGVTIVISADKPAFKAGVVTNSDGTFSFANLEPGGNYTLRISSIGFDPVTQALSLKAGDNTLAAITLQPSSSSMNEVVVVGYGTQKKIDVTGAVDQISGAKLAERPIANVFQGLQGASPGLNITYSGGRPGALPNLNIRGMGTISSSGSAPLILIDGIASTNDDLLRINPSDIESITTLRDGSSAAIYGARAAFGVLLINTKKGREGKQTISYNNYFAKSRRTLTPDPITDPFIFMKVMQLSADNTPWHYATFASWQYDWGKQRSEDPSVPAVKTNPNDPSKWAYMGNTDWNDYFFAKANFSQYHNLSISGSSAGKTPVNYLLSADYTKENGLNKLAKDDWNRYGMRANIGIKPLKWLSVENNFNVYQLVQDQPTYNILDVYYTQPINVDKNPDGTWANTTAGVLAAQLKDGGRNNQTRFGFQNLVRGIATALNGDLTITGSASIKRELWKYHTERLPVRIGYGPGDVREINGPGSVTETNGTVNQNIYDLFANYHKKLGVHEFNVTLGYNEEYYQWAPVTASRGSLISASLPHISLASGDMTVDNNGYYDYAIRSYFGRVDYTFRGKYILKYTQRADGSSRFPPSDRWSSYPSFSGAWIVSRENFWKAMEPVLPTFKLRAAYSTLGNQSVDYYGYIQTLRTSQSGYLVNGNFPLVISGAPRLNVDPTNYTWENVSGPNFGADLGFLKNRLTVSFDYYIRNTKGMLAPETVLPGVLGTSAPQQNAADMQTKGWELAMGYENSVNLGRKPFNFAVRGRVWDSRSTITKYKNPQGFFSGYREGQEVGEIWGLTSDGLFKNQGEIDKLDQSAIIPWNSLKIVPGWPKYVDRDGNGKIETGNSKTDPKDLSVIGNTSPRYQYGFNIDLGWNNIDFSVFFQGIGKMDYYPQNYLFWGPYQQPYANIYSWNLDFYRGAAATDAERATYPKAYIDAGLADANLNPRYPALQAWLADQRTGQGLAIPQTNYLQSAAYLRLKNLTIGYSLPQSVIGRTGLTRARIFFTGENLYEFSSIKQYIDPEAITSGNGWNYPFQRKYSMGINVTL